MSRSQRHNRVVVPPLAPRQVGAIDRVRSAFRDDDHLVRGFTEGGSIALCGAGSAIWRHVHDYNAEQPLCHACSRAYNPPKGN